MNHIKRLVATTGTQKEAKMIPLKRYLFLFLAALFMLNATLTVCGASERMSSDSIKFQRTGWEVNDKGANLFVGTLQNVSGKDIEFIGLRCAFYDANNVQLDHGVVILRDVLKEGYAKFEFYPSAPVGTVTATITNVDVYAK